MLSSEKSHRHLAELVHDVQHYGTEPGRLRGRIVRIGIGRAGRIGSPGCRNGTGIHCGHAGNGERPERIEGKSRLKKVRNRPKRSTPVNRRNVGEICEREEITAPFAYKILKKLQKAKLVRGYRGVHGGYSMNRTPGVDHAV